VQSAVAEEQALLTREDGKVPVILGLALVIEPFFLVFYRVGLSQRRSQKTPDFPIVQPFHIVGQVFTLNRAEGYEFASEHGLLLRM
jgi:hypothetical protein